MACTVLEAAVWTGYRVLILMHGFSARRVAHGARRMCQVAHQRGHDARRQVGLVAATPPVGYHRSHPQEAPRGRGPLALSRWMSPLQY